jgi:hypothetical protein
MERKMSEKQSINFLRGVPAEEALSRLIPMASEGYEKVIRRYGTDVLQYGHFTGFKPLRDLIGRLSHFFSSLSPEKAISLLKKQVTIEYYLMQSAMDII